MRFQTAIFPLLAALAAAKVTVKLEGDNGISESIDICTNEWVDLTDKPEAQKDFTSIQVTTNTEVAACFIVFQDVTDAKWITSSPFGEKTEWGNRPIKAAWCQEVFALPHWIAPDNDAFARNDRAPGEKRRVARGLIGTN
ncbi:hypothetical protein P154DRAFT_566443 [Amniculicola lignicola CBS 123094]|uniref:Uncharacterized protein n=1 Tax=Amniculicola lignicola CBS 123094 TaxID=1392246 RepID=A0A6A5W4B3_9PLEO|nr:hypothetical protein P154DRAFT_566443 [Amniculicola lignicola CBS 123094]